MEKVSGRIYGGTVADAFSVNDFNRISPEGLPHFHDLAEGKFEPDLEGALDKHFEDPAGSIIKDIVQSERLELQAEQRFELVKFVAVQWYRTPGRFYKQKEEMRKLLPTLPMPKNKMRPLGKMGDGEDELRDMKLFFMPFEVFNLASVLQRADIYLHKLSDGEFVLGDDPVTVFNSHMRLQSNVIVGFPISARGSEVFLPISPDLGIHLHTPLDVKRDSIGHTYREPIVLDARHRDHLNKLQLQNALFYLTCKSGKFPDF